MTKKYINPTKRIRGVPFSARTGRRPFISKPNEIKVFGCHHAKAAFMKMRSDQEISIRLTLPNSQKGGVRTAMDVASYFLGALGSQSGNDLTNIKIQKLCAYAQGLCLALLGRQLFDDEIESGNCGPLIPAVYQKFHINMELLSPAARLNELFKKFFKNIFADDEKFILELVENYYGIFTTKNLIYRSCRDFPGEIGSRQIIAKEDIRKAFMSTPLVIKMKTEVQPCPYIPKKDKLVPLSEVWDVLEI